MYKKSILLKKKMADFKCTMSPCLSNYTWPPYTLQMFADATMAQDIHVHCTIPWHHHTLYFRQY